MGKRFKDQFPDGIMIKKGGMESGKKIFVWKGSGASGQEKMSAGMIAAKMKDHVGEEIVHVDKAVTTEVSKSIDLFKVSDVTGEMKTEQVKEGNLSKDDLDANDAFLVSAGALGIWVWLGRKATKQERQSAMQLGEKFIKENGLPPQTALTRTFQGGEPEEFKSLFASGW